jgi:hypothetical protein
MKAHVLDTQLNGTANLELQVAVLVVGYVPDGTRLTWVFPESRIVGVPYENRIAYA